MGGEAVPKLLFARAPKDAIEERKIRKLAGARHAPADWIRRAQIISLSWERLRVPQIARELGCAEKTVRYRLARFNDQGLDGLGDRPGVGRKRRILRAEGVHWRRTRSWATSHDPDFAPKEPRLLPSTPARRRE
jgi:hypothetical protein